MKTANEIFALALALAWIPAAALEGQDLYVANLNNSMIGEYGLDGSTVNAALITGLNRPAGIAISGQNNLYVANYAIGIPGGPGSVGEYGLDGSTINASLVSLNYLNPAGLAIYDNTVYAVSQQGVGEYSISPSEGPTINASLISRLNDPTGIAIGFAEDVLFVASGGPDGTIGEYGLDGSIINASLITGLNDPTGIAISGNDLFVANSGNGTIGEYTLSGQTVNASLISGLSGPWGLAISTVPEPSPVALVGLGVGALWLLRRNFLLRTVRGQVAGMMRA
ncbi:MAG TPA: PEP-CTERM sorting domain-containing protein [Candidatus Acidoferrales bacterium]|jgi:hypothetical protein|nr:PEP-CTERM sorting domain-containing protein [Candidatus Acidoferrales bacterium]